MGRAFFVKKWQMGGVFSVKWKMFFCKKIVKWGVFFCKKVGLSSTQGALCTVSVFFYFTFYLFGGGVYAPNAPPYLRAWMRHRVGVSSASFVLAVQFLT